MAFRSLITLAAQGAGTLNSADQDSPLRKDGYSPLGVKVVIDITAVGGAPTATFKIQGKDPLSGKYFDILTSAALAAAGTTVLTVYPGVAAAANVSANDVMPRIWRVNLVVAGTTPSVTATVSAIPI